MKKGIIRSLVLVLVLMMAFSTVAFGLNTGEAKNGTPKIDGVMEGLWNSAKVMNVNKKLPESIENVATAKVSALWDEDYLYIFAVVTDSTPHKNPDQQAWHMDGFEIFIDEGNEKFKGADKNDSQYRVDIDNVQTGGQNWDKAMMKSSVVKTKAGFNYEIAIPLSGGGKAGQTIGLDFQVNDDVGNDVREGLMTWNTVTPDAFANFSVLGNLTFLDDAAVAAAPAATPKPSTTTETTTPAATTDSPKTADAGSLGYLAVAFLGTIGLFIGKKRSK